MYEHALQQKQNEIDELRRQLQDLKTGSIRSEDDIEELRRALQDLKAGSVRSENEIEGLQRQLQDLDTAPAQPDDGPAHVPEKVSVTRRQNVTIQIFS